MTHFEANRIRRQMQPFLSLMIVVASTMILASCGGASSKNNETPTITNIIPNTIKPYKETVPIKGGGKLVKNYMRVIPKYNLTEAEFKSGIEALGGIVTGKRSDTYEIYFDKADTVEEQSSILKNLKEKNLIDDGIPNTMAKPLSIPNDQILLDSSKNKAYPINDLSNAWDLFSDLNKIDSISVGVVDNGFVLHNDILFTERLGVNGEIDSSDDRSSSDDDSFNSEPVVNDDEPNHGMNVAGIIGAIHGNSIGTGGVASVVNSSLSLYAAKTDMTQDGVIDSVDFLANKGVSIINISIGYNIHKKDGKSNFETAMPQHREYWANRFGRILKRHEVILVIASGNNNTEASIDNGYTSVLSDDSPASLEILRADLKTKGMDLDYIRKHIIVVGASTYDGGTIHRASYSNFGKNVTLLATGGGDIVNGICNQSVMSLGYSSKDATSGMCGTSQATPFVTGTIGLMLQANPNLDLSKIKDMLVNTAYQIDDGKGGQVAHLQIKSAVMSALNYGKPTDITPKTATVGATQEFVLTGEGLLEKPYNITIEGCPSIQYTSTTSTKHVFSCIPTDALSSLVVITNPDTGALVSKQLAIDFISAPVVLPTAIKIILDAQGIDAVSGVVNGNVSFITGRNGGKAAKFNGVSDPASIRVPNSDNIKFDTGATFDLWVRRDSMTGMNGNAQTVNDGNYVMALLAKSHDSNGTAFTTTGTGKSYWNTYDQSWFGNSNCTTDDAFPVIPIGEWYRITYTVSPTTGIQTYINKKLYVNCPDIHPSFDVMNTQDLYIGQYSSFWYPLNGAIQDISIYKAALTSSQVAVMP